MTIQVDLPPVDIITALANTPPLFHRMNNDTGQPMNAMIAIMEDIYMRNEQQYQDTLEYSTIIAQPILSLGENLNLQLREGFFNFRTSTIEYPTPIIETKIIDTFENDEISLIAHSNELLKLIALPRYKYRNKKFSYDHEDIFEIRQLCQIGSIGLLSSTAVVLIGYFINKFCKISILFNTITALIALGSLASIAFSIMNIVMVSRVLIVGKNRHIVFDLLTFIIATILSFYTFCCMIICFISLLVIYSTTRDIEKNNNEEKNDAYTVSNAAEIEQVLEAFPTHHDESTNRSFRDSSSLHFNGGTIPGYENKSRTLPRDFDYNKRRSLPLESEMPDAVVPLRNISEPCEINLLDSEESYGSPLKRTNCTHPIPGFDYDA